LRKPKKPLSLSNKKKARDFGIRLSSSNFHNASLFQLRQAPSISSHLIRDSCKSVCDSLCLSLICVLTFHWWISDLRSVQQNTLYRILSLSYCMHQMSPNVYYLYQLFEYFSSGFPLDKVSIVMSYWTLID
jgi:hypothetical protein